MPILLLLLALLAVAMAFYAQANGTTQDITLFGGHWSAYLWVPVAIAAGAGALLFLLAAAYMSIRMRRLRRTNAALQRDVDLLRLDRATAAVAMRERAGAETEQDVNGHPVTAPSGAPAQTPGSIVPPWPSSAATST